MTYYTDFKKGILIGITKVNVTSPFGKRTFLYKGKWVTDFHNGVDMTPAVKLGAFQRGKVIEIRDNVTGETPASGNYIILQHANNTCTLYKHLVHGSLKVKAGDIAEEKQEIATAGSTGMSTGPHSHFEIRLGGKAGTPVDPIPYLQGKKTVAPYQEPSTTVIDFPNNTRLLELDSDQWYRESAGLSGKQMGKLEKNQTYAYIGNTTEIDGYKWGQIKVDNKLVYAALNPVWNTIKEPEPIIVIKVIESPIDTTLTDGVLTAHITRK